MNSNIDNIGKNKETNEIDIIRLLQRMWSNIWIIAILSFACALIMFVVTKFFMTPQFESTVSVYIHDNTVASSVGTEETAINNEIVGEAAEYLQNTYCRTLISNTTLDIVIDNLGLDCKPSSVRNMIKYSFEQYPYFDITVTCDDPNKCSVIANELADVLYEQVAQIVGGSTLTYVDKAIPPESKSGPSVFKNTLLGLIVGFALGCGIVLIIDYADNKIYDDEYLYNEYGIPVLASISDYDVSTKHGYKYYNKYSKTGKYVN